MNEHVLEYFLGDGRRQHAWMHKDEDGSTDASSTLGTKIGGRLDWVVLEAAVKRLLSNFSGPIFSSKRAARPRIECCNGIAVIVTVASVRAWRTEA